MTNFRHGESESKSASARPSGDGYDPRSSAACCADWGDSSLLFLRWRRAAGCRATVLSQGGGSRFGARGQDGRDHRRGNATPGTAARLYPRLVLQIASGMYFRPGVPVNETLHRATVYTNGFRVGSDPVELPMAGLRFSTGIATVSAVTVEVVDRLEAERADGEPEFMIATSGQELVADVAAVLAFTMNTTWSTDLDLVRRLVPDTLSGRPGSLPSSQLRRTFDPQVLLADDDMADVAAFCSRLLALRRPEYEKAIRAIRRVVDATLLVADDVTLAYTLFVAAIESLAAATAAPPTTWDAFDGRKRALIEPALDDLSGAQAQRVRSAILQADALGLGRKFQAFTLDHLGPSFFRAEAVGAHRPISASALPHALDFAYRVRSRQVHALQQLAPEMWAIVDRADTIPVDGRPVLSLEGLSRLCRHVIRQFVDRAPTDLDTSFNYREALPGIVRMQLAPQYWIFQADGLRMERGPAVLDGFLELLLPLLRGDDNVLPVNMTDVLERIEALLPGEAAPAKRAPLVALYVLWHRLLAPEFHRPDPQRFLARFGADLERPSAAAFAVTLVLGSDMPWSTEELAEFAATRASELRRGRGQPLPAVFDAALQLCLGRQLWQDGRVEDALTAVGRAVEAVPGDANLIAFEEQARADTAHAGGLGSLDVRSFLLAAAEGGAETSAATDPAGDLQGADGDEGRDPGAAMRGASGPDGVEPGR